MNDIRDFVIDKLPVGIIAFDQRLNVIFSNRKAQLFLKRHELPDEIKILCRRIFNAIKVSRLKESFPGDIHVFKKFEDSPSRWSFKIHICEESEPFVIVFIIEDSISNKIDLNKIRGKFGLARRETDVLRCALDGLRNCDIADELEICEQTVKNYLNSIYNKLGVENRIALTSFLLRFQIEN